jgi:hypothetical protein
MPRRQYEVTPSKIAQPLDLQRVRAAQRAVLAAMGQAQESFGPRPDPVAVASLYAGTVLASDDEHGRAAGLIVQARRRCLGGPGRRACAVRTVRGGQHARRGRDLARGLRGVSGHGPRSAVDPNPNRCSCTGGYVELMAFQDSRALNTVASLPEVRAAAEARWIGP